MNDEKRLKAREITIYYSLIFATGIMVVIGIMLFGIGSGLIPPGLAEIAYPLSTMLIGPILLVAFCASIFFSVRGFFTCSWLLRKHLLIWYGSLILLILIGALRVLPRLTDIIHIFGVLILFALPIIWVRNASRS